MKDTTVVSLRLPSELHQRIKELALKQDRSVNYVIVSTLEWSTKPRIKPQ